MAQFLSTVFMAILAVLLMIFISGCAPQLPDGVTMSDEERVACKEQGCTVWTQEELERLARIFFQKGYAAKTGNSI